MQHSQASPSCSGASEKSKKWACGVCTYENWISSVRCTMCRTPRAPKVIKSEVSKVNNNKSSLDGLHSADIFRLGEQQQQSSSSCCATSSSSGSSLSSLPTPPSSEASLQQHIICDNQSHSLKWSCTQCTYLNWPRALKCVQCLTPRKRRQGGGCGGIGGTTQTPTVSSSMGATTLGSPHYSGAMGLSSPRASPPASLVTSSYATAPSNYMASMDNLRISGNNAQDSNNERNAALALAASSSSYGRLSPSTSRLSIVQEPMTSSTPPPSSSITATANCGSNSSSAFSPKWSCPVCTYENWPRSQVCVLCGAKPPLEPACRSESAQHQHLFLGNRDSPSPPAAAAAAPTACDSANNYDYERRMRQLRRRLRESDWTYLAACMGVAEGDMNPVEAFLSTGGDPTRKLTYPEVALLGSRGPHQGGYEAGHTLVHLAIRFHREEILATLLSQLENGGSSVGVKCVPSYVAPDLASAIRRHIAQSIRQRKGNFPCYYIAEWATYSLPPEIEDLSPATQEQLFSELLDGDAQKELEEADVDSGRDGASSGGGSNCVGVINWSDDLKNRLRSGLSALWNRSAGDCLLDSVLQATWGVFDRDNTLRRAMADSLHEASHVFFPRWKEWELRQALELDFTIHESQLADDWTTILSLAAQPGNSLEQIHIFCLSHVLRRPIIVYGVKYVKSWKGENLGFARFEGVYLPLLWDPSFCSRSPIALGYTRGHFCALVPPEAASDGVSGGAGAGGAGGGNANEDARATFLPLVTPEEPRQLLPIHFLSQSELGRERQILHDWLDVCVTTEDGEGLLVAKQKVTKPPLLVAQMTEEWLNHYRKLAQSWSAPFSSRGGGSAAVNSAATCEAEVGSPSINAQPLPSSSSPQQPSRRLCPHELAARPTATSVATSTGANGNGSSSSANSAIQRQIPAVATDTGFSSDGESEEE